ncbi:SDR family oxidoreductase [Lutibacter flavus]|uniref:Nucleoside-diphosphate-sugar epimerase n=1 Tax=Lutibacter flavus TaxID=691689 RepID=A0A238X4F5_9FLAO|nr:SDR family oxidoreductase [Lutibacter flavus]SNR53448.1 Nucleoside-diphosphate-sugar epimerase [Lutibacter flavus]
MILVTGGTGLVGSHLLYQLSLENDTIKAIHRKNSDLQAVKNVFSYFSEDYEALFKKIQWIEADITDVTSLVIAFKNVTEVYHSAALVSFDPKDYRKMRKINIEGTSNIVNFCIDKKVKKLCFVSSIATIEKSANKKMTDETNEWNLEKSNYGYAITKYGAEIEVWRASQEGIDVVIVNPGVILGGGFWKNGSGAIFSKIFKGLNFYTEGVTGFVAVNDVVKIMMVLMKNTIKNERYILVAENVSFKTVFSQIALNFNKKEPSIKVSKLMSEIGWRVEKIKSTLTNKPPVLTKHSAKSIHNNYTFSSEKIKKALDFEFEPITSSIKNVCEFYKKDL